MSHLLITALGKFHNQIIKFSVCVVNYNNNIMKLKFMNIILTYLIISICINTYLCMNDHTEDIHVWKKFDMSNFQGNLNLDQVAVIGTATKEKPLKVDYSKC